MFNFRPSNQPVRRHIQQEHLDAASEEESVSLFKSLQILPPNAMMVTCFHIVLYHSLAVVLTIAVANNMCIKPWLHHFGVICSLLIQNSTS